MSFAVTSLGSVGNTANISAYSCSVFQAPVANTLVLVGVMAGDTAGTPVEPTDVSGVGITFSLITSSITFDPTTGGSQTHNFSAWRGMTASPLSSLVTATFSNAATGCAMHVLQISGVSQGGSNGDRAVGKSANSVANNVSCLTVIAPSATSTANAWLSFNGHGTSAQAVPTVNYTAIDFVNHATPSSGFMSAWTTLSTGTTVGWSTGGATESRAGILIELVLDNPVIIPPPTPINTPLGRQVRLPSVPSNLTGPIAAYLRLVVGQLNSEAYISRFSGANPNTSGFTGIPGNLLANIGSATTTSRLWGMAGSVASIATNTWHPFQAN